MASGQATPSHVLNTGVELSVPCSEIHPLFYMPCIQGFVTRWYLHECEAFAGENMGFVRHSPVQMIAYMEHCGGKIHIRLLGKRRETERNSDHFGFEKPSSSSKCGCYHI